MKEQFATYKIALAVKELGFDESCFAYYEISDLIKKGYRLRYVEHEDNNPTKQSKNISYILAPLWQQAIDWFRERHKYHIIVDRNEEGWFWEIVDTLKGEFIEQFEFNEIDGNFIYLSSFEQAREQAILKAIELCQNKK